MSPEQYVKCKYKELRIAFSAGGRRAGAELAVEDAAMFVTLEPAGPAV